MVSKAFKDNYSKIDWGYKEIKVQRAIRSAPKKSHLPTPMIVSDYEAYECPVTGNMIEGRTAHEENLAKTGCRILERGEFEDVKKNGKKRLGEKIDNIVDKAIDEIAPTLDI